MPVSHKAPKQYRTTRAKGGAAHKSLTVRECLTDGKISSQNEAFQG